MGLLGNILAAPIKIINAPIKVVEDVCGVDNDRDRIMSKPLESLSKHIQEIDEQAD